MKIKISEVKKLLLNPKRIELFIKEWGGSVIVKSITVAEQTELVEFTSNSNIRKKLLMKSFVEPQLNVDNIDDFMKRSFSVIEYIYDCLLLINCMHPKMESAIRAVLEDNHNLYNKFSVSEHTKIPVWSYGKPIDEWYILEYYLLMFYRIISDERKGRGGISGSEVKEMKAGRGKSITIKSIHKS